ncbi:hypothetical protein RhiirB3_532783 [Rhizophagus irregularis]|nr:hypothetical protein RhiirB3_532783 [Rhizophagus irregularis]
MLNFSVDCLNDIIECLENDPKTLYSCLLVNRIWCKVSVRIYWRNIRNLNTLIACLPNDSKKILHNNGISISTSKTPVFNYASFCKYLEVHKVINNVGNFLQKWVSPNLSNDITMLSQEIFKLLMCQISSLREITFIKTASIIFTSYPGAKNCLKNLTKLYCNSNIYPGFFHLLSQVCHTIQILRIVVFNEVTSNDLANLISVQPNLKHFYVTQSSDIVDLTDIIALVAKNPNSLTKFFIRGNLRRVPIPLLTIARFTNLQKLEFKIIINRYHEDFNELQYVIFPRLQSLIFSLRCPKNEILIKFLENNGKNLKEFCARSYGLYDNSLDLAIAKFCPNLRNLSIRIEHDVLETLKLFLVSCQYLESLRVFDDRYPYVNTDDISEKIMKYSPKLKLHFCL